MTRISLLLALLLTAPSHAADGWSIHPEPQQTRISETMTSLSSRARIAGADTADKAALALLKADLVRGAADGIVTKIIIGERGDSVVAPYLEGIPEKSGAYRLRVARDALVIAGHDGRGTYYAIRSLEQLVKDGGAVPEAEIVDWPDVPFRGAVEGFYGTPWSHAKRLSLIGFFGKHKLNTYIYGPKDDPYHSSPNWRKPYPPAEAARIRELAAASAANHVDFVWAIHPGKDIQWNDADFHAVMDKFESMYGLGVRSFAVFFDDISGEGTKADKQAELLNRLNAEFVRKKPDVTPLVMCPTQYNKAWSGGDYLETLGKTLDKSIHIMWTGNSVVADLDRTSMEWINQRIQQEAYIWWNFPVTDYVRNHLLMGPVYGNGADIKDLLGGFVSNPMERSEASKIALYGVADYSWNVEKYDPDSSWHAAIREVMPGAADAFEVFARHNSDLGPNGHGYRRKESEAFAPVAEKFLENFRQEKPVDSPAVRAELLKIREAPAAIRAGSENPELMDEISPWLDAFAQLGRAGVAAIDANSAMLAGKAGDAWTQLAEASSALAAMDEIDRTQNRNPYQPGVKTGSLVVEPFVRELVATTGARFLAIISGHPVFRPSGITSASERGSLPLMLDGRDDTYFYDKTVQKAGDWFGVDFGGLQAVLRIRILQGRNDGDHDRIHDGILEGTEDGNSWQTIGNVANALTEITLDPPQKFRSVRLREVKAGSAEKPDLWTAIRAFDINPPTGATLRTDVPAFSDQPVRVADNMISISPSLEVHAIPPGSFIGLLLPEVSDIVRFAVDLGTASPEKSFALEAATDGGNWKPLAIKTEGTTLAAENPGKAHAVRVRNTSRAAVPVTLAKFELTIAARTNAEASALSDGNLATVAEVKSGTVIPRPAGETAAMVTLLISPDSQPDATISAIISGRRRPLGTVKSALARFQIPAGTTGVESSAPLRLHEVVWSEN